MINAIRQDVLKMVYESKSSHIGSCFSIVEILYTLYFQVMNIDSNNPRREDRDRFILSKGHASAALYATLARRGFFSGERLAGFYCDGGTLPGHLDMEKVPGIEASAGSLGHGLAIGVGMALANRQRANPGRVFVLLGDGECNEGSVWEAVMLAASLKLHQLTAIVDSNQWQGFGRNHDIIDQSRLADSWRSFGWEVREGDGHDCAMLADALSARQERPTVLIAHTVKGKGVSFMEDKLEWHYKSPDAAQYRQAMVELAGAER